METVKSADGTIIPYECAGDGPALIASVGAFCTRQASVAPDLAPQLCHSLPVRLSPRGKILCRRDEHPDRQLARVIAVPQQLGMHHRTTAPSGNSPLTLRSRTRAICSTPGQRHVLPRRLRHGDRRQACDVRLHVSSRSRALTRRGQPLRPALATAGDSECHRGRHHAGDRPHDHRLERRGSGAPSPCAGSSWCPRRSG
jgi:hypothetical protein